MTALPSVSVVIPWKDRPVLRETLRANLLFLAPERCEVVVVNCGGERDAIDEVLADFPPHVRSVSTRPGPFNKSFAQNIGAAVSTGPTLLLLDADVLLEDDLIALAGGLGAEEFLTVAVVRESDHGQEAEEVVGLELAYITEISVPCGKTIRLETNRVRPHTGVRSGPGLLAVRREHFAAVGGSNSALRGWGWEDLDLVARLQFELRLRRVQAGRVLHLSHPDDARALGGRSRAESERENYLTCLANYTAGLFSGSLQEDVLAWKARGSGGGPD